MPFYDPNLSYEDNYIHGPFGHFSQNPPPSASRRKKHSFLGYSVDLPFGIAAGPLLNSAYISAAWRWGFSISTYKTVRGNSYPSYPHPNVIKVSFKHKHIRPGDVVVGITDTTDIDVTRDGITNSFGVPFSGICGTAIRWA